MAAHVHASVGLSAMALLFLLTAAPARGQNQVPGGEVEKLRQMVVDLERRVATLEAERRGAPGPAGESAGSGPQAAAALETAAAELRPAPAAAAPETTTQNTSPHLGFPATLPGGATLNFYLDGYYESNLNRPGGRVNDLRAYDVLSNAFSISQTGIVFDWQPDLAAGRRYGFRADLQFGQATEAAQGNPVNEPRPEIYRNIFQAYGTYVVPLGTGIRVDVGKWVSSLGIEGTYAKDQWNYSRSWLFDFLPFYHSGVRASYAVNRWLTANYGVMNGSNHTEPVNGYKAELFGVALQPASNVSWTVNSYLSQENPDAVAALDCTVPVQPGLCLTPIRPAPDGKLHIVDSYATWQASPRLKLAGEGDYAIQRIWAHAAPGESSAPVHVDGGAGYAQYQLTPRHSLTARGEYLSDREGWFSNASQTLKEVTGTYKYSPADNFELFLEFRHDWSNRRYFVTRTPASLRGYQDTAGVGLVWWYGGKQGSW